MSYRVIAIRDFSHKTGILNYYGHGVYMGDRIPSKEPYSKAGIPMPCIRLDNGYFIWEFQCHWEDLATFEGLLGPKVKERVRFKLDSNIIPLPTPEQEKVIEGCLKEITDSSSEERINAMLDEEIIDWVDQEDYSNSEFESEYDYYKENYSGEAEDVVVEGLIATELGHGCYKFDTELLITLRQRIRERYNALNY